MQKEPDLISFENTYVRTDYEKDKRDEQEGDVFESVCIDGYPDPEISDEGTVVAQVFITHKGDIVVSWHHNGYRMHGPVAELIRDSIEMLESHWKEEHSK